MSAAVEDELARRRAAGDGGDEEPAEQGENGADGVRTGAEPLGEGADESADGNGDGAANAEAETEPETVDPGPKLLQTPLPGDWAKIGDKFGGEAPSIAEIRLMGGSMPIEGSFAKGTELDLLVRVRVSEVHGVDILDGWGNTKHTIRRHRARLISVQRTNR